MQGVDAVLFAGEIKRRITDVQYKIIMKNKKKLYIDWVTFHQQSQKNTQKLEVNYFTNKRSPIIFPTPHTSIGFSKDFILHKFIQHVMRT